MAARFTDAWLEELRSRVPIEEVVSEYVQPEAEGPPLLGPVPVSQRKDRPSFSVDSRQHSCIIALAATRAALCSIS